MANIEASVSGDWHTGSNWVGGVVPTATDVAILNGKVMTLVEGASITCSSIEGGTALESLVNAIKAKTDQLDFTVNGVVADSGTTGGDLMPLQTAINDVATDVTYVRNTVETGTYVEQQLPNIRTFIGTDLPVLDLTGNDPSVSATLITPSIQDSYSSLSFDSDGSLLIVDISAAPATSEYTFEGWAKLSGTATGTYPIIGANSSSQEANRFALTLYRGATTSTFMLRRYGISNLFTTSAIDNSVLTSWFHWTVVRTTTTTTLYINGVNYGSSATSPCTFSTQPREWYIGRNTTVYPGQFYGWMRGVRITSSALYHAPFTPDPDYSYIVATGTRGAYTLLQEAIPVLQTVTSIKTQTDQLDFTVNGVVTDSGTSATDYTDDLQQIKNLVVAGLK